MISWMHWIWSGWLFIILLELALSLKCYNCNFGFCSSPDELQECAHSEQFQCPSCAACETIVRGGGDYPLTYYKRCTYSCNDYQQYPNCDASRADSTCGYCCVGDGCNKCLATHGDPNCAVQPITSASTTTATTTTSTSKPPESPDGGDIFIPGVSVGPEDGGEKPSPEPEQVTDTTTSTTMKPTAVDSAEEPTDKLPDEGDSNVVTITDVPFVPTTVPSTDIDTDSNVQQPGGGGAAVRADTSVTKNPVEEPNATTFLPSKVDNSANGETKSNVRVKSDAEVNSAKDKPKSGLSLPAYSLHIIVGTLFVSGILL